MIQLALVIPFILVIPIFAKSSACTQDEGGASCTSSLLSDSESDHSDHSVRSDDLSYDVSLRSIYAVHPVQVCHLLGPELNEKSDEDTEEEFAPPANYQHVVEVKLNIGFKRLRKAMLHSDSGFWTEAVLKSALEYQNITTTQWDKHPNSIGHPSDPLPPSKRPSLLGAHQKTSYLMPGSKLLKPKMAYEEATLTSYTSSGFSVDKITSTPDVPFGQSFVAKTRLVVEKLDANSCRLTCSVETEFPNGAPMGMGSGIRNGMKRGTLQVFDKMGSMIQQCVEHYQSS